MDKFLGNPAGRLYRFLEFCSNEDSTDSILNGWARYSGLDSTATPTQVISRIAPLFGLPQAVRERLRESEDALAHYEDYGASLSAADAALACVAQGSSSMVVMQRTFGPADVTALRQCSRVLEKDNRQAVASEEQLDEIRTSAKQLIESVTTATDLPPFVAETLLKYAQAALRDADLFKIGGIDALVRNADELRGQAGRDPGLINEAHARPDVWESVVRFSKALLVVATLVHAPLGITADIHQYQAALTSLAPIVVVAPPEGPVSTNHDLV